MDDYYLYHCFPRRVTNQCNELDIAKQILQSIINIGLLLTPEVYSISEVQMDGAGTKSRKLWQKRVCFTELMPRQLEEHCEVFGHVAIEWDMQTLKRIGANPCFYFSPYNPNDPFANTHANSMLSRLGEIQKILQELEVIQKMAENHNGHLESQLFDGTRRFIGHAQELTRLLAYLNRDVAGYADLLASVQAMFGYFYPLDNIRHDKLLDYYKQREWRIVGNQIVFGKPLTEKATWTDMHVIEEIDSDFFNKELNFPTGLKKRSQTCQFLREFEGVPIIQTARRIIVSPSMFTGIEQLIKENNLNILVTTFDKLY